MRILLPPSESKTQPLQGPTLDLLSLTVPELTAARQVVADKLVLVSRHKNALSVLGAGQRAAGEVHAQRDLYDLPCAPARTVYTGVLYEAAQLRPGDDVWIFSALFGLTRSEDFIPAYRLNMSVRFPRIGRLSSFWRNELKSIDWDEDVYVDMRSTPYQVWNPPGIWWKVRVVDAMGKAVSHRAKHYRGLLTRALLDADSSEIADVAACIGKVSVEENGRHKSLTLTVSDTP